MNLHFFTAPFCFAFIWFRVQGSRLRWRLRRLFYWAMPESSILVTSHSYDTREGIVSHMWHEILRLSPHLFWLRLFSHRAFSSAQDDDTGERMGSHLGDTLRVLELSVLYTIRVGPWRRGAPKAQDGSTKRCERLCETIRLPPVIPTGVEGSFLQTGKTWVRERRKRKHQGVV